MGPEPAATGALSRLAERRPWLAIFLLVALSTIGRGLVALSLREPRIFGDELYYWHAARSIVREFAVRFMNVGWDFPSVLYPLFLTTVLGGDDLFLSYDLARCLNALLVSLVACPVFLIARRFLDSGRAVLAAAFSLLVPGLCYSATTMAENLFMVVFATTFHFMLLVLDGEGGAIPATVFLVLTYFTKPHALGLFAGFGLAVLVVGIARGYRPALAGLKWMLGCWAVPAVAALIVIALRVLTRPELSGAGLKAILMGGSYQNLSGLPPFSLLQLTLVPAGLFATFGLAAAFVPLAASFALLFHPEGRGGASRRRTFAILLVCSSAMFIAMSTQNVLMNDILRDGLPPRFHERYLFCLVPVATWALLDDDLRRHRTTLGIAVCWMALFVVLLAWEPFRPSWFDSSDSPSRIAFGAARFLALGEIAKWVLPGVLLAAVILSMRMRGARAALACSAAVLIWLNAGWYLFQRRMDDGNARRFALAVTQQVSGEPVVLFLDGLPYLLEYRLAFWLEPCPRFQAVAPGAYPWWHRAIGGMNVAESGGLRWAIALTSLAAHEGIRPEIEDGSLGKSVSLLRLPEGAVEASGLIEKADQLKVSWKRPEPQTLEAGGSTTLLVDVTNAGDHVWPSVGDQAVSIGYHFADPERRGTWDSVIWDDGNRGRLRKSLAPGETARVVLPVRAPAQPGDGYRLVLAAVIGKEGWAGENVVVDVKVVPSR